MSTEISAAAVMELREKTGAGMMDCKKALTEAGGDTERAIEILRQKGLKKSAEKASRVAREGLVLAKINENRNFGVIVELNCETDFVARNEEFARLGHDILEQLFNTRPANLDSLLASPAHFNHGKTVGDSVAELTGKIGEKIQLKRFAAFTTSGGVLASYIHPGNKLGVLVQLDVENLENGVASEAHTLAYDLAMQTAAMSPSFIQRSEIPREVIEKEMNILREQGKAEGKPEKVLENVIKGRLEKYYQEVCLMEQIFVKDSSKSIKELVNEFSRKLDRKLVVQRFERYRLGE